MSLLRTATDVEAEGGLYRVTVQQADGFVSDIRRAIFAVGKASILPAKVHHEPELPEGPHRAEQGDQQILIGVPRDLADKDLTVGSWGGTIPH